MKHSYLVCISSDSPLSLPMVEEITQKQNIIVIDKVYTKIDDVIDFEKAWQNGLDAIQERQDFYNDINKVFMGLIETFQRQGIIKQDGKFDIENYTTASIVHLATKMANLGIKMINDKADKINAEIKEAKNCLKKKKTPFGLSLSPEGIAHYEAILEEHSEPPFKISATMLLPIQMILSAMNNSFNDGGREINFDFEAMIKDMQPLGDITAKWCVKAAVGSEVANNFLTEAGFIDDSDLANMTNND